MDTLERLAQLIRRQRTTQGEHCHLLITQQMDNHYEGYKILADLLHDGYFSTVVTMDMDVKLEQALDELGLRPSDYQVFVCGRDQDDKVALALDGQERGICIIKLRGHKNGLCAGDVWSSLLDYLKDNIVVVGYINEVHNDIVQTLIAERDKSSMYYIVPAESSADRLLSHIRSHQRQSANFLICGLDGMFVNFFHGLAGQLLQKDSLVSKYGTIIKAEQHDGRRGKAKDTSDVGELPPQGTDQPASDDEVNKTKPLPAIPPAGEGTAVPTDGELVRWVSPAKSEPLGRGSPPRDSAKNAILQLSWPGGVDVFIVTATRVELKAFLDLYPQHVRRSLDGKTYYDLGYVGRVRIVVVQANDTGPLEAFTTTDEGVRTLSPHAAIMVGIAFGLRPIEQQIGDVLVSMLIHDYDTERVGTGADDQPLIYQRGTRVKASAWLIDRFRAGSHEWSVPPEIHFGSILAGSKLIDNKDYQGALSRAVPDAIGGEMEGVGFSSSAIRRKVDWLLVKGISDWADGTKKVNKEDNQRKAAENAAEFALFVIGQEDFLQRS